MRIKLLKRCVSIVLSTIMLFWCAPTMFAVTVDTDFSDGYEHGAVLVSVKPNAPSIEYLLSGFEIESSRLITPGSNTLGIYYVKFTEKTKEIVWKAIEVLKESSFVEYAEPNYYQEIGIIEDPTEQTEPTKATEQTETTQPITEAIEPTVKETTGEIDFSDGYEHGAVLVSVKPNAPSIEDLLPGFEIESWRLITPGSNSLYILYVKFTEKTKEIVWKAIEILKESRFVEYAEPNYYQEIGIVEDPTEQTEPTETTEPVMGTEDTQTNFVKGDADGDGELSVKDATCIQMYLANFISAQNIDCSAANVSGTGTVTINDATMIQMQLAGLLNAW